MGIITEKLVLIDEKDYNLYENETDLLREENEQAVAIGEKLERIYEEDVAWLYEENDYEI